MMGLDHGDCMNTSALINVDAFERQASEIRDITDFSAHDFLRICPRQRLRFVLFTPRAPLLLDPTVASLE